MTSLIKRNTLSFRSYSSDKQTHCHDFCQIVLPSSGVLELEIAGVDGAVNYSVGAFIPPDTPHAFCAPKSSNQFIIIDLQGDDLKILGQAAFFEITPPVQGLVDYLTARLTVSDRMSDPVRESWCMLLVDALKLSTSIADHEPQSLRDAIDFIMANLPRSITVQEIAKAAAVSQSVLHRQFRNVYKTTPHLFLAERRLDEALWLLSTSSLSVAEIAVRTGHADQSGLTRRLRLARGFTPAAFRRANSVESA